MGWNDRMDEWDQTNLPPDAIDERSPILDINEEWLKTAPDDEQTEAMKAWFLARYCDPANETPYISAEGGYIFVHGGPYSPREEIASRFQGLVSDQAIDEVVNELLQNVGDDWAPIHFGREDEYDDDFGVDVDAPTVPIEVLSVRLNQISELLSLTGPVTAMTLARKFAYSGVITALESFLWETMTWSISDEKVLERIITKLPHFSSQGMKLEEIFDKQKTLQGLVRAYLQDTVWHKWDEVGPLLVHGLQIKPPSFRPFIEPVKKRHDIVHRSGHQKDGTPITVEVLEINDLMEAVRNFAIQLNASMTAKFFQDDNDVNAAAPATQG